MVLHDLSIFPQFIKIVSTPSAIAASLFSDEVPRKIPKILFVKKFQKSKKLILVSRNLKHYGDGKRLIGRFNVNLYKTKIKPYRGLVFHYYSKPIKK